MELRAPKACDLLATMPWLRGLAHDRRLPSIVSAVLLFFLAALLVVGVLGTPVGNRNGLVVAVWIVWWAVLILVAVPLGGRAWCGVCPVPLLGDWLQRGALLRPRLRRAGAAETGGYRLGRNVYSGLGWRWPRRLSNTWLQTCGFLLLATFSGAFLTSPFWTACAVAGMVGVATVCALAFRQRAFCRFLCPVGGFLGLYSLFAPVAVRRRCHATCATCVDWGCVAGNERGWGCPWIERPSDMARNSHCGLCLECIKTCPHENMSLFARRPLLDLRLRGYDEAWKAFVLVSLVVAYSAVFLGPWGGLKEIVNVIETGDGRVFAAWAAALWGGALVGVPGTFLLAAWLARALAPARVPLRPFVLASASALVPFGLMAWMAFSLPVVCANGSYAVAIASDPFGVGWDLLGTARLPWTPVLSSWVPWAQAALVLLGQAAALGVVWVELRPLVGSGWRAVGGVAPTAAVITILAETLLWIQVG